MTERAANKQHYASEQDFALVTPLSEIVPGLYMGMRPNTYVGYDLVISCEEHLARKPMEGYAGLTVHLPLRDEDDFTIPEKALSVAVRAADDMLLVDGRVLVHCTGGLNRSGLVVAEILKVHGGWTAYGAVAQIRAMRDLYCLCNRHFERWVLGEQLPTAETTTLG